MVLPLQGMRVIELGAWVVGPTCARVLGELGANVIKVEEPAGGDSKPRKTSVVLSGEAGVERATPETRELGDVLPS